MQWPEEIITAFSEAIDVQPSEPFTKGDVVRYLLDETARRAVRRANGDPGQLASAYSAPFTPLGSVMQDGLAEKVERISLLPMWGSAVDHLTAFVRSNARDICAQFVKDTSC
jgi:hypothetical protein